MRLPINKYKQQVCVYAKLYAWLQVNYDWAELPGGHIVWQKHMRTYC